MKKLLSLSVSMLTLLSSLSVINTNAGYFGIEYNKPLVVNVSSENCCYSEILDDGKIMSFRNDTVEGVENGSNMYITYYSDNYAEDYNYYFSNFSIIFKLKENYSIDDFNFTYNDMEFKYSKLNDDNVYQLFNTAENSRGVFTYSYAREIEKAMAENSDVEDTDVVWGYEHEMQTSTMPVTRLHLKDGFSVTKEDFSFLEDAGYSIKNVSEDCQNFEICYNDEDTWQWKYKTEAMRMILQNIEGAEEISTDFYHHALARIDGYSMLDGYSIKGVYDYNSYIFMKGDANGDAKVDISDVLTIASYISDSENNNISQLGVVNADVNGDGVINANDALTIQQYLAGVITEL